MSLAASYNETTNDENVGLTTTPAKAGILSTALARSTSTVSYASFPFLWVTLFLADGPRQDSYPQGFDCSNPTKWAPVVTNYHSYHEQVDPGTVWYMPEFQGLFRLSRPPFGKRVVQC